MTRILAAAAGLTLLLACEQGKDIGETCSYNSECASGCCYQSPWDPEYRNYCTSEESIHCMEESYGSSEGGCGGSYGGPYYEDYQVESQCEAIWASDCSAEAVDAGCEILDQWASNGVPNVCPYC